MSKKLSSEQINELFEFCYFQSVVHYDIQVELVDHLASNIEQQWESNPEISFDDALYNVSEQFGGHAGFVIIRQEKEKALRKKYRRILWQFVGDYFKLPKLLFTIFLIIVFYCATYISKNDQWLTIGFTIFFFVFFLFYMFYYAPKHVKIRVKERHPFILNQIAAQGVLSKTSIGFGGVLIQFATHTIQFSPFGSVVFAIVISVFLILLYADCFYIPKRINEHFDEQFPQLTRC